MWPFIAALAAVFLPVVSGAGDPVPDAHSDKKKVHIPTAMVVTCSAALVVIVIILCIWYKFWKRNAFGQTNSESTVTTKDSSSKFVIRFMKRHRRKGSVSHSDDEPRTSTKPTDLSRGSSLLSVRSFFNERRNQSGSKGQLGEGQAVANEL